MKYDTAMAIALRAAAKQKGVAVQDLGKPNTPQHATQPHDRNTRQLPQRGIKAS